MTSKEEKECQLLLSETEYVNQQISSYMDLQIKTLTFIFAAIGIGLGFLFGKEHAPTPEQVPAILIVISLVGSFGILQSVVTYGVALTYIDYKANVLAGKWQSLLGLDYSPLEAAERFRRSSVKRATLVATFLLFSGCIILDLGIPIYLIFTGWKVGGGTLVGSIAALCGALAALVSVGLIPRAMKTAGIC